MSERESGGVSGGGRERECEGGRERERASDRVSERVREGRRELESGGVSE